MDSDARRTKSTPGQQWLPMEQIVEAMADGVLVVGLDGKIVFANPAAMELLGRGELIGSEFGYPVVSAKRTEIELIAADRSLRCAEMRAVALSHSDPRQDLFLVSLRDITDRRRAELSIKHLNSSLQERVRELESYTHSVSHDLQSPLRSIRTYAGIVMAEAANLPPEVREYLSRIEVNADRMSHLIRDLLRLSRSSLTPLDVQEVNLGELVREIVGQIKNDDTTGARFVIGDLPTVLCDRALVAQVLENLFINAIKYRKPAEAPRITVACEKIEGWYRVAVCDNGLGFAPEYSERIFRLFERLHSSEQIAGTGIGLSLVQRIITRHGGKVWAEAQQNQGASFYFTLPVKPELIDGNAMT